MSWGSDSNANRFKKSYIQGFLDVSGGNLIVESSSQIQVMSSQYTGQAALLIKPDRFSVFTGQSSYDISYVTFAALGFLGVSYQYTTADIYNRIKFIGSNTLTGNVTLIGSDASGASDLIVYGNISTQNNGNITGARHFFLTGDASLNQKLYVAGNANMNSNVAITLDLSVNQNVYVTGRSSFTNDVSMNRNVDIGTGNNSVAINKDISENVALDVSGSTVLRGPLSITGDASFNRSLQIGSDLSINRFLYVNNNALFNTDVSINQNLYVSGRATFGRPPTNTTAFEVDVSGQMRIYEPSGTLASATNGSLVLQHGDASGVSSIVFLSTNDSGSDYAYIQYQENVGGGATQKGLFTIGIENENGSGTTADRISLYAAGGSGFVGVNTKDPSFNLDVSGNARITGTVTASLDVSLNKNVQLGTGSNSIAINKDISPSFALDVSGITNLRAPLYALSDVSLSQKLFVSLDASFNQNLSVGQDVSINRSLYVRNRALFSSDVSINGFTKLNNSVAINKDISSEYALDVSGITNFRGPLYTLSDVSLGQKLFVSQDASFNKNLSVGQDVSINRSLYVLNRALFSSDVSINGFTRLNKSVAINKDISSEYALDVSGITNFRGPLYTLSDVSLGQKLFVSQDASFNQNLSVGQDVSINRSLYVLNRALFSSDVSINGFTRLNKSVAINKDISSNFALDISGQMRIYEPIGSNVTTSSSVGTLTLEHGDASGCSSIMFTSPSTISNGDYAYIKYQDLSGATSNTGLLTIGIENDPTAATTADKISLYAAGGTGYVGVNTLNPQFNLDVTGQIRATTTITASTITASTYTGSSNISLFTATTANISIGGATGTSNLISIGTSASVGNVRIGGNIKLGYGRTYVGINKDISTGFLFDVSGDSMFRNKLFVNSDASFGTNVNVVGDVSVNRFLFVTDRALFGNDVSINGYTQHSNSVSINKDISSEYALDVSGLTNLRGNLTTTNITTNGSLSITGGGSLTVNGLPVSGASVGTALTPQGVQVGNDTNYYVTIDKPNFYNDPSLVIYYNFDTSFNNGTVVKNIATSGPSYDASFNRPSVFTTDGMIDTSVQKYGTASLKNVGGATPNSGLFVTSPVPIGTIMSFSMWIKKSDVPSVPSFDRIFEYSDNATSTENNTIALDISNSGVIIPVLTNGTSTLINLLSSPIIPYTICDNTWNHIVWIITATKSYIYINGAIKHYDGITGTVPSVPRQNAYIAYSLRNDVNRDFSGNIDEFRYYKDKALNQAEIFQLSNNTFYNLDICGGFLANGSSVIYEPVGSKAGPNSGSLTLLHGDASGSSSIMFKSVNDPSEYGYIQYEENSAESTGVHYGLMTIGIENDTGAQADRISLFPSGGAGYVGVNTKNPEHTLDVSGNVMVRQNIYMNNGSVMSAKNSNGTLETVFYPRYGTDDKTYLDYGSGGFQIRCGGVEKVFMKSNGTVGINTTNPSDSYKLDVNGNVNATSYNASSDYRIKENVMPLDLTFNVDVLKPVSYVLKDDKDAKLQIGFIAHEVQEFYPFLVNGNKDGPNTQSINYNGFIGILTKEIKDLKKKASDQKMQISDQEERLASQEERLASQEARIKALEQEARIKALEKLLLNK